MIDFNLVDEFIVFLKEKGKVEEAEEMEATYKKFKEDMDSLNEELVEKLNGISDTPQRTTDEIIAKTNDGVITLEDCDFITFAVLPGGNMHIVDMDPEDIKDLIAETGHFRVHEKPVGKAEINMSYNGQKPDKKYLN
jgi:hypothetical protein